MNFAPRSHDDDLLDELLRSALSSRTRHAEPPPRVLARIRSQIAAGPAQRPHGLRRPAGHARATWLPVLSAALGMCLLVVGWMASPSWPVLLQSATGTTIPGQQVDASAPAAAPDGDFAHNPAQASLWHAENDLPIPPPALKREASPAALPHTYSLTAQLDLVEPVGMPPAGMIR